ncbi:short-chain dehydrogenase/reductase SDR [Oscillochloris trichoides DG-6]|uniref:Short-chain dehydrogenase/reductase SDR n=1 Tax=Oscillochloris trichoides DG-6 TaxID=765420 RepID=E1IBS7_9CHLR|nr:3-oxoacyl-ACP reductase family protein [Oscillochloris trichoides]EFO81379.1 short-chain dehydrogenase/reductase SDR [Oscillochloris trichoides DG-6]
MGKLDGKVAVVTGASRGIGRSIAIMLAKEGAKTVINFNSSVGSAQEVADEIAAFGGTAMLMQADVAKSEDARAMIKKVVETWGRIDVLVNNAGITRDRTMRKLTDDDWLSVINTNLNSVYWCTSAAMPFMIEQKYGRIINISSYVGQAGNFGQANYAASKGGIIAFTKTAAIEFAKYNITVNSLAPGFTLTDMLSKVAENVQEQIKSKIPMGRFGLPEEMAKAVLFLAADADYITGQQINVNGGVFM